MSRALWYAKDVVYWTQGSMIPMGHRFGPSGPAAFDHILGCAKVRNEDGRIGLSYDALAEAVHLNRPLGTWWNDKLPKSTLKVLGTQGFPLAQSIVSALVELNELEDCEEINFLGQPAFEAVVANWGMWQFLSDDAPLTPAQRQRVKRLREAGFTVSEVTWDVLDGTSGEIYGNVRELKGVRELIRKSHAESRKCHEAA